MKCSACGNPLARIRYCEDCKRRVGPIVKRYLDTITKEEEQLIIELRAIPAPLHIHVFKFIHTLKTERWLPKVHYFCRNMGVPDKKGS